MAGTISLLIDSSGPDLNVLVRTVEGDFVRRLGLGTGHAEKIFPTIAELLDEASAHYSDLTRVGVTTGPGSFTGVRVGLAAAIGVARGTGLVAIGVPGLVVRSLSLADESPFQLYQDARRNQYFMGAFDKPGVLSGDIFLIGRDTLEEMKGAELKIHDAPALDMKLFADLAETLTPEDHPAAPLYIRSADAKPQVKFRVARK